MKGKHIIYVRAVNFQYKLELTRNISVIQGNSASGKTTLANIIISSKREDSPYEVECDVECYAFTHNNFRNIQDLYHFRNMILIFDEDIYEVKQKEFAEYVRQTDCYIVIINRYAIPTLPYSCRAVYELRQNKYIGIDQDVINNLHMLFSFDSKPKVDLRGRLSYILTEDSNAGYDFFKNIAAQMGIACESAGGNSNVAGKLLRRLQEKQDTGVLVIVDGAAFGPYYDTVRKMAANSGIAIVFLPESFEWLLLNSSIFNRGKVSDILKEPYLYIESSKHISWERYFTALLQEVTRGTELEYTKKHLNKRYFIGNNLKSIKECVPEETGIV